MTTDREKQVDLMRRRSEVAGMLPSMIRTRLEDRSRYNAFLSLSEKPSDIELLFALGKSPALLGTIYDKCIERIDDDYSKEWVLRLFYRDILMRMAFGLSTAREVRESGQSEGQITIHKGSTMDLARQIMPFREEGQPSEHYRPDGLVVRERDGYIAEGVVFMVEPTLDEVAKARKSWIYHVQAFGDKLCAPDAPLRVITPVPQQDEEAILAPRDFLPIEIEAIMAFGDRMLETYFEIDDPNSHRKDPITKVWARKRGTPLLKPTGTKILWRGGGK